jgi:hypothetical protein
MVHHSIIHQDELFAKTILKLEENKKKKLEAQPTD